ncbi:AfaD family invasin [Serratia ficaria]|uniref:AfaD family invasin n=1 Tax=Serratia ficaria TaxID=61651 RepID=UPI00217B9282|nr:AfaD family invasin [Serratia ficaria]CAI1507087.1 putative pilin structural protein SafD [Serratia ficaria]
MHVIHRTLMTAILALTSAAAQADDLVPEVTLSSRPPADTRLQDGTVIATGQVVFQGAHSGYQLWLEAPQNGTTPGRYLLSGKRRQPHPLRVRLAGNAWSAGGPDSQGLTRITGDERVSFDIVVDGNQEATADEYVMTAAVAALLP